MESMRSILNPLGVGVCGVEEVAPRYRNESEKSGKCRMPAYTWLVEAIMQLWCHWLQGHDDQEYFGFRMKPTTHVVIFWRKRLPISSKWDGQRHFQYNKTYTERDRYCGLDIGTIIFTNGLFLLE